MDERLKPFVPNPVMGGLLGLCPLVAAADSFADGAVIGLGAALSALALGALLPLLRGVLPQRLRSPVAFILAASLAALYSVGVEAYSPALASGLGLYLPLTAVNCIIIATLRHSLRDEGSPFPWLLPTAAGYLLVALILSGLREFLGAGTLTLPSPGSPSAIAFTQAPPLRLLVAPAGGFMLLGCFAALYRFVLRIKGRRIP
jgi:Na+-translocating ferredoxin:NAD+ oxidoreductase subunit E